MGYIAFFDMLGTRAAALTSRDTYSNAIDTFHSAVIEVSKNKACRIYGYSDNAYMEFKNIDEMFSFFDELRERLIKEHLYFTAAVVKGSLNANTKSYEKGDIMQFTSPEAIKAYSLQSSFHGIGVALSDDVVKDVQEAEKRKNLNYTYCKSAFVYQDGNGVENVKLQAFYDISYQNPSTYFMRLIVSDYLMASLTSERAGRYYMTPLLSMIQCLEPSEIEKEHKELCEIITLSEYRGLFDFRRIESDRMVLTFFFLGKIMNMTEIELDEKKDIFCEIMESARLSNEEMMKQLHVVPLEVLNMKQKKEAAIMLAEIFREDARNRL